MDTTSPPAPAAMEPDFKDLAARHPLFSRLSGQVIWLLFEEQNARPQDCDAFLERYLAWREDALTTMARLEANPQSALRIRVADADNACADCQRYNNTMLPANDPDLLHHLPPYSLGCRCRAEYVTPDEAQIALTTAKRPPQPIRRLHCPSGWFFSVLWADEPAGKL